MLYNIVSSLALQKFFRINLSSIERGIVEDSLREKYIPAIRAGLLGTLLILPATLLLDTTVIATILIPATTVAGTAWYAVSLANLKKKFESFGTELTRNLFDAFLTSLGALFLLTAASLFYEVLQPLLLHIPYRAPMNILAGILGMLVIGRLLFKIFLGSLQYDINDSLLTGQNEAAERFFKKSLSLLHSTASSLRSSGKSLQVANYLIGVSFFEVFSFCKSLHLSEKVSRIADENIVFANKLIFHPAHSQEEADSCIRTLVESFLHIIRSDIQDEKAKKSIVAIQDELSCLVKNTTEDQAMVDTRVSVILEEISELLESLGENLFIRE